MIENPVIRGIPRDLKEAKENLRNQLFRPKQRITAEALALRKAKRHRPTPDVNLVGVGIGEKVAAKKRTGELCVKVLVAKKYPRSQIRAADLIPADVDGIPTDIEGVGYPVKFAIAQRKRHRPVPGGVSVGLDRNAVNFHFAGTLGAIVVDKNDQERLYALSNNHVLADENRVEIGAGVVQPGTLDGGRNKDRVARLTRYIPLKFENKRNWMDAAIAEFEDPSGVDRSILDIGAPSGSADARLGWLVRKSGRTTGLTEGIVRIIHFDVFDVEYDQGYVRVEDVLVIEGISGSFSQPGDSGSAIVDPKGRVVALLFAGSPQVTFAIPIRRVLRRLGVRIAA
jgi:S1-C subfamily serine protease